MVITDLEKMPIATILKANRTKLRRSKRQEIKTSLFKYICPDSGISSLRIERNSDVAASNRCHGNKGGSLCQLNATNALLNTQKFW